MRVTGFGKHLRDLDCGTASLILSKLNPKVQVLTHNKWHKILHPPLFNSFCVCIISHFKLCFKTLSELYCCLCVNRCEQLNHIYSPNRTFLFFSGHCKHIHTTICQSLTQQQTHTAEVLDLNEVHNSQTHSEHTPKCYSVHILTATPLPAIRCFQHCACKPTGVHICRYRQFPSVESLNK